MSKTYVATVVQDEVLRVFVVARVVDLDFASIDVDTANLVGGALPVWILRCILGRLDIRDPVTFFVHAIAVESILDALVATSAGDRRSSDGKNGCLESGLSCDRNGSGRSSGGGSASGLADQQGTGARHDRSRVLLQDSRGRQRCRVGSGSALVDNASGGGSGGKGSLGDDRGDK
jgi:hypothetical protein